MVKQSKPEKLYCYVDETGQDTQGRLFIVVAVVVDSERNELESFLEECEVRSGKRRVKWTNSKLEMRKKYLELALIPSRLKGKIFYRAYSDTKAYQDLTAVVITQALNVYAQSRGIRSFEATVVIDGLNDKQRHKTSNILRRSGVHGKVRGLKDESNALIRLADTIAGLVRDHLSATKEMQIIANKLIQEAIITTL